MLCHTLGRHAATNLYHIDDVLHVHVHVCAELGCVWTWGYGQACGKKRCDVLTPEKRFLRHSNAVQVAGGQSHSVALTGALFERRVNKRLSYLHERSVHRGLCATELSSYAWYRSYMFPCVKTYILNV